MRARRARQIAILRFENADYSQFRDSLQAAALIYGLEPTFPTDIQLTVEISAAEVDRRQRDAVSLILSSKEQLDQQSPVLLVTDQDLFAERMRFVFGLANKDLGIAVMSTSRLTEWVEDLTPSRIQERILKEAAHEIGHLRGLPHCERESCLMSFSNTIEKVDLKLPMLCDACERKLRR